MSNTDDKILQIVTRVENLLTEQEKEQKQLWSKVKDFVGNLANFIQVVSWVVPAISTVIDLLKNFGNSKDNVSIVQQLQSEFDRLVSAFQEHIDMRDNATIIAEAQTGLENIQDSPKLPPGVFVPGEDLNRVTDAKNKLTSRAFWTRPFIPEAVFTVPRDTTIATWFAATPPREPDQPDQVFDPTLSLPALLTAIQIYSAATTALAGLNGGGSLPQPWKDHLGELAESLNAFHQEIANGIVGLRIPNRGELLNTSLGGVPFPNSLFEDPGDSSVGAAFLYSNQHIVDEYPLVDEFRLDPTDRSLDVESNYPLFLARFKLGTIARKKALYIVLKLHETWETVQHLRTLAQATPEPFDRSDGWSVSEIAKALEETFPPDPGTLREVRLRLVMVNLRKVVTPNVGDDLGLRALLTRVTP